MPAILTPALMDTVLGRLAVLFLTGANGDVTAAREAAVQMLAAYNVETADELSLAAEIIDFGFHALEALSQAATPDLPLAKILRLRGSAVSLSREAHKGRRKLDQLQRDRRAGIQPQPAPAPPEPRPHVDKAVELVEFARQAIESASKNGGQTWTQSYQKRQTAKRIAKKLQKNQLRHASQAAQATAAPP